MRFVRCLGPFPRLLGMLPDFCVTIHQCGRGKTWEEKMGMCMCMFDVFSQIFTSDWIMESILGLTRSSVLCLTVL
jgi:hypothetical protein